MFRTRLRCHFCGTKSNAYRGDTEFQCSHCEAFNFFDIDGKVVDTPYTIAAGPPQTSPPGAAPTFTRPVSRGPEYHGTRPFCATCLSNQRIYTESLAQYLPDDDHPQYRQFEEKLPQYKAELEKRYPPICTVCAPKAQELVHKADYYGMSQHMAKQMEDTRKRGNSPVPPRTRDDWRKWSVRALLGVLGMVVYASLLLQMAWHAYGFFVAFSVTPTTDTSQETGLAFDPTFKECAQGSLLWRFDPSCYQLLSTLVPNALLASFLLTWYNDGLKKLYDHTHRYDLVSGQKSHFRLQLILLIVRAVAWFKLSDPTFTSEMSTYQLLAAHGFMLAFTPLIQRLSERTIHCQRWRFRGKITPKPDEVDLFTATAGPAPERYTPCASATHPLQLFPRDDRPFPIENLAPRRGYAKLDLPSQPPPSPPDSQSVSDDGVAGEAMDIDWHQLSPTANPPSRWPGAPIDRTYRPKYPGPSSRPASSSNSSPWDLSRPRSGWGPMRDEMSRLQAEQDAALLARQRREADEQAEAAAKKLLHYEPRSLEQNPFRGRLPPAPMSMERRLRNPPPSQVRFAAQPESERKDFMRRMREGFVEGRMFGKRMVEEERGEEEKKGGGLDGLSLDDDDDDKLPSPAKHRTRGQLDLRGSSWHLPADLTQQATGLEDLFGGRTFRIADDEAGAKNAASVLRSREGGLFSWKGVLVLTGLGVLVAGGRNVEGVRRVVGEWVVGWLEG